MIQSLAKRKKMKVTLSYCALVPFLIFFLFPLYWMLITSFKNDTEISSLKGIPLIIQSKPTLAHYKMILFDKLTIRIVKPIRTKGQPSFSNRFPPEGQL